MLGRLRARPTVAAAAESDDWAIMQGEFNGRPMFARFNTSFRDATDQADYGVQIDVAIPLNAPDPNGLPQHTELEQLNEIEDLVVERARGRAVFVGVFTTSNVRQLVLYSTASDWVEWFHHGLESAVSSHSVQCRATRDPDWKAYNNFVR